MRPRLIEARLIVLGVVVHRLLIEKPPAPVIAYRQPFRPNLQISESVLSTKTDKLEDLFAFEGIEVDRTGTWARYELRVALPPAPGA